MLRSSAVLCDLRYDERFTCSNYLKLKFVLSEKHLVRQVYKPFETNKKKSFSPVLGTKNAIHENFHRYANLGESLLMPCGVWHVQHGTYRSSQIKTTFGKTSSLLWWWNLLRFSCLFVRMNFSIFSNENERMEKSKKRNKNCIKNTKAVIL